jgi:hypothetical protein
MNAGLSNDVNKESFDFRVLFVDESGDCVQIHIHSCHRASGECAASRCPNNDRRRALVVVDVGDIPPLFSMASTATNGDSARRCLPGDAVPAGVVAVVTGTIGEHCGDATLCAGEPRDNAAVLGDSAACADCASGANARRALVARGGDVASSRSSFDASTSVASDELSRRALCSLVDGRAERARWWW